VVSPRITVAAWSAVTQVRWKNRDRRNGTTGPGKYSNTAPALARRLTVWVAKF
jgi:hypothetical protein